MPKSNIKDMACLNNWKFKHICAYLCLNIKILKFVGRFFLPIYWYSLSICQTLELLGVFISFTTAYKLGSTVIPFVLRRNWDLKRLSILAQVSQVINSRSKSPLASNLKAILLIITQDTVSPFTIKKKWS